MLGVRKSQQPTLFESLPAAHARPLSFDYVVPCGDHVVPLVLRRRRTGVIGQDPDFRADRELRQSLRRSGSDSEDAMLLARLRNDQVGINLAGQIADETV